MRNHEPRRARRADGIVCALLLAVLALPFSACSRPGAGGAVEVVFPGSAVGAEAEILQRQLARFMDAHPDIRVVQRRTPDAADQRHQLYVQWLNAGASQPDILQLDVVWTPEFAAAGWILPLERFTPEIEAFLPASIEADSWDGRLYALPWFVDVGMLYWRTDLMDAPPTSLAGLRRVAERAREAGDVNYGFVWQGARYEGLVTVFLEHVGAFGGSLMDADGTVRVDEEPAVRALTWMRDAVWDVKTVPQAALTWHEEETRFAFQNGQAAFMRNWPYAWSLLEGEEGSRVAGRVGIAPMPGTSGGAATAALGGGQLAINANSDHPEAAWAVIEYLTQSEQMLERAAVVGQYPARAALYDDPRLADALGQDVAPLKAIVERATPRPVTPVYTQLSELLQIQLHRALTRQAEPREALETAARQMRKLLRDVGLAEETSDAR
ncbi:MAG: ABC transporter substrate-binding protein [Gemmatimonadales bacterium]|jgi:multiple sugar transport system substrate-binding protein